MLRGIGKVVLPMQVSEIKRHSLVEEVAHQLAADIRHNSPAADLLPSERQLAVQFGVSRPVIREATKRLELQGLVEIKQGIGIRVVNRLYTPISEAAKILLPNEVERLRQSLEVRMTLEPEIARRAAGRADKVSLARLHESQAMLKEATGLEVAMEADLLFHRELARISGNEIFGLMLDSIADLGRGTRRASMTEVGFECAAKQHAAILKAVEKGNANAAEKAMRLHIERAVEDFSANQAS